MLQEDSHEIEKGVRQEAASADLRQAGEGGDGARQPHHQDLSAVLGWHDAALKEWWDANDKDKKDPNFFKQLSIAKDGGLTEVFQLFNTTRFLWAAVNLIGLIVNVTFIVSASVDALVRHEWVVPKSGKFLLINHVILGHIGDKELRTEVCLALLELTVLLFLFGKGIYEICRAVYYSRRGDPWGWYALAQFFFEVVPDISTYSALRMLSAVTPAIFIPALNREIAGVKRRGGKYCGLPLWFFLLRRVFIGFVGFDAFMVKFQEVSAYANATDASKSMDIFFHSIAFLNQMLGVVQVNRYVRQRLMIYIFGGEDGWISPLERTRQEAWYGMLAREIWRESRNRKKALPFLWFNAVMLSYSDSDFQQLTLNEKKRQQGLADGTVKPSQVQPFSEPTQAQQS